MEEILDTFLLTVLVHLLFAQLAFKVRKKFTDFDLNLEKSNFKPIIKWLRQNVHSKGNFYKIDELLTESTKKTLILNILKIILLKDM